MTTPSPHNTGFSVTLPPEGYPCQEDYSSLVISGKSKFAELDNAFLHGDLGRAQVIAGDLFQITYNILRLTNVLLIERNNRDNRQAGKYQPTSAEIIRRSYERLAKEQGIAAATRFYEGRTPGLPKEYPGNGDGSGGTGESGG